VGALRPAGGCAARAVPAGLFVPDADYRPRDDGQSLPTAMGVGPVSDQTAPVPRLALSREEAAASIGMSIDSFERHVQPSIRMLRLGRLRLVPVRELERWLDNHAEGTLR
jgi:hypothetical protein